jgi:hypothetical protein
VGDYSTNEPIMDGTANPAYVSPASVIPRVLGLASCLLLSARSARAQDCSGGGFLVAAVVVTGSALYDLATAPASARRYNRQHLAIVPLIDPRRGSYGLALSWSFGRSPRGGVAPAPPAHKSPGTAAVLSIVATGAPIITGLAQGNDTGAKLFLGGLVIGPSVGHLYAEQFGRGFGTIALRGAATALGLWSIVGCFSD